MNTGTAAQVLGAVEHSSKRTGKLSIHGQVRKVFNDALDDAHLRVQIVVPYLADAQRLARGHSANILVDFQHHGEQKQSTAQPLNNAVCALCKCLFPCI